MIASLMYTAAGADAEIIDIVIMAQDDNFSIWESDLIFSDISIIRDGFNMIIFLTWFFMGLKFNFS